MSSAVHQWSLWSTTARVCVTDPRLLDEAVARVRVLLGEIDDVANRFRSDSEVSRLGARTDTEGGVRISSLLAELLEEALRAADRTGGAVDPTVGVPLMGLGYDRDIAAIPENSPLAVVVSPAPGWHTLHLDGDRLTMPAGTVLDLGATTKAVAADRSAALVHQSLGCGVLVSIGGDMATAGQGPLGGWQVLVQDDQTDPAETIRLDDGWAVATSSTTHRTWRRGSNRLHHIVEPATGLPAASGWHTVTVAAATCLEANTASTATMVKGDEGLPWLRSTGLAARLVDQRGRVRRVGGWPEERSIA